MEQTQKILLITTGGTIGATVAQSGMRIATSGNLTSGADLLSSARAKIANLKLDISIDELSVYNIDSSNANPGHWKKLIDTVVENYDKYNSFIITHGTDTMGYVGAALSYGLGNLGKPVIITGSQVPFVELGDDARTNLENCIRVLHHGRGNLRGVFGLMNSAFMAGSRIKKVDDKKYQAFETHGMVNLDELGASLEDMADNSNILTYMNTYGNRASSAGGLNVWDEYPMDAVFSIDEHPGINPRVVENIVRDKEIKGIVLRGYGIGTTNLLSAQTLGNPTFMRENLLSETMRGGLELAKSLKKPAIMTTNVEKSNAVLYHYDTGKLALDLGVIPAFDTSPEAAKVKLAKCIAQKVPYERMMTVMTENIRGEIDPRKVKHFQDHMSQFQLGEI
jgi:L-asparaginase